MLTIGQNFPEFRLTGVFDESAPYDEDYEDGGIFREVTNATYSGKWLVLFSWPKAFSPLCPLEVIEFSRLNNHFEKSNAQVLGMSIDSDAVLHAWRESSDALKATPFPMLSDVKQELSKALGIINVDAGVCNRATFIIDPKGVIRHVSVNDLTIGRNAEEVLRVLKALQTDGATPCDWQEGDMTL